MMKHFCPDGCLFQSMGLKRSPDSLEIVFHPYTDSAKRHIEAPSYEALCFHLYEPNEYIILGTDGAI